MESGYDYGLVKARKIKGEIKAQTVDCQSEIATRQWMKDS